MLEGAGISTKVTFFKSSKLIDYGGMTVRKGTEATHHGYRHGTYIPIKNYGQPLQPHVMSAVCHPWFYRGAILTCLDGGSKPSAAPHLGGQGKKDATFVRDNGRPMGDSDIKKYYINSQEFGENMLHLKFEHFDSDKKAADYVNRIVDRATELHKASAADQ
jgi:hypothetical protein